METPSVYPGSAKGQNIAILIVIIAVVILVAYVIIKSIGTIQDFFDSFKKGAKGITDSLGITDSEQEQKDAATIEGTKKTSSLVSSPWNAVYYKSAPAGTILVKYADMKIKADKIYDSVHVTGDDPNSSLAAFKTLTNKAQVSWLCDVFSKEHSQDLFSYMEYYYDTEHQKSVLVEIINYVNSLPAFTK